ncbi:MAG TPA: helix-turn-helix transcriptional regulator [Thermoanaerobaculia bacterium]|nr:helix-turn-helix transcriptional regulator [Thermoanaerobaculia bacterium]
MPYVELMPSAALRPWVECFWTRSDDAPSGQHRVLPDGCADLVFDLSAGESAAVGTMTKPLLLPPSGSYEFLGVRFRPGRAAAFLRMPLAQITDARVPLGDIWKDWRSDTIWSGGLLARRTRRAESPSLQMVAMLEAELLRRLDPDRDRRVDEAVARIVASGGTLRIEPLAREIGISRQHLARQFLHHVGVSPKTFARVMRFRRVADMQRVDRDWADVAITNGFYDQSHLIAEFRELAGTTPDAFHFSNR